MFIAGLAAHCNWTLGADAGCDGAAAVGAGRAAGAAGGADSGVSSSELHAIATMANSVNPASRTYRMFLIVIVRFASVLRLIATPVSPIGRSSGSAHSTGSSWLAPHMREGSRQESTPFVRSVVSSANKSDSEKRRRWKAIQRLKLGTGAAMIGACGLVGSADRCFGGIGAEMSNQGRSGNRAHVPHWCSGRYGRQLNEVSPTRLAVPNPAEGEASGVLWAKVRRQRPDSSDAASE